MNFTINGYNYKAKVSTFPGGEEYVKIPSKLPLDPGKITVHADIRASSDVMVLLMLTDALRRYARGYKTVFVLNMPYLPYARQDRVCAKGESFSLKVFTNLINNLKYNRVLITDCHSDVGLALLDNVVHTSQQQVMTLGVKTHNMLSACDVIIAPDAGASKKAQALADAYGKPMVQCSKTRNSDGSITVTVLGYVTDKVCLVVDDICDGGGTYLALAGALKNEDPKELQLAVTHGLFSKGKEVLAPYYTKVEAVYDWTA